MLKPPAANVPGMTDTLDFVKRLWGSMNIPGANMPGMSTLSGMASPALTTEDLDKRIADLKAVESWLNMNLSMLRGTIHALEVQRSTLVTLKSMGASMAEAMRQSGVSPDKMANMPFAPFFAPGAPAAAAAPAPAPAPAKPEAQAPGGATEIPGAAAAMPAAIAWWNMLQEQFAQAVTTAMTPSAPAAGTDAAASRTQAEERPGEHGQAGNGRGRTSKTKPDKP